MIGAHRRQVLQGGCSLLALAAGRFALARPTPVPVVSLPVREGVLSVTTLGDRAFRIRIAPPGSPEPVSPLLGPAPPHVEARLIREATTTRVVLPHGACVIDHRHGAVTFVDATGRQVLHETPGSRALQPGDLHGWRTLRAEQGFDLGPGEHLLGTGCFQDGYLDIAGLPRRLCQVNTQISLPFVVSTKGYGLLWHNTGLTDINRPAGTIDLVRRETGAAHTDDVTTAHGNARIERREAVWTGAFTTVEDTDHAFQLNLGRKMTSRYHVAIDGKVLVDHANQWLPASTGFIARLSPGSHRVEIRCEDLDQPRLRFGPKGSSTTWASSVADGIDYIVILGDRPAAIMAGLRQLLGGYAMMPVWSLGYIHCRERFHSAQEILETAREFRRRRLPCDMIVQDWQYWGHHGWNAMRFDEAAYPDPAAMIGELHAMDMRFMLSVWAKVSRDSELGQAIAAHDFFIPDTDWVDFFNPAAARFYGQAQAARLGSLGVDAWWQDATEPENDDLEGRQVHTAQGGREPGEIRRNIFPLAVTQAVYTAQRQARADVRTMILTRSAAPGQQRYPAATWSGDIGHDWETLRRQIPAGLNMAAAGYPWWTVDAGGFFRPGASQYTDPAYRERFLRWFQFATFLPLLRVHGYQTDTEFWRFGEEVEQIARQYLDLRYRLLPYIYTLATDVSLDGMPLIRPLAFDFGDDAQALRQSHAYMFGPALHVAPVVAPDVRQWPVYLPHSPGGWYDFWTGQRRDGGQSHMVDTPLDRIALHVRAGAIVPMGPARQSTAGALGGDLDILVWPGRDGTAHVWEDDGLSYGYEHGERSRIDLAWDDARGELTIAARQGAWTTMPAARRLTVNWGHARTQHPVTRQSSGHAMTIRLEPVGPPTRE